MTTLVEIWAMLYNDLKLEEIWSTFGNTLNPILLIYNLLKYFTGNYKLRGNLSSLPYNAMFLSIRSQEMADRSIIVAFDQKMVPYEGHIKRFLQSINVESIIRYESEAQLNEIMPQFDEVFMNSIYHVKDYGIANNFISYFYMLIKGVNCIRFSYMYSVMWILYSMWHYFMPIMYTWPLFFKTRLSASTFATSFVTYCIIIAFMRLVRSLQEIDHERTLFLRDSCEPLLSSEYILDGASIFIATCMVVLLTIVLIYCTFLYPKIMFVNILAGIVYYVFMSAPFIIKYVAIILSMVVAQYVLQPGMFGV
jgi:hypothetical protein